MEGKPLSDQVAVVTGASSGIGEAISKALAKAGARVVLGARRTEKLEETVKAIEKDGGKSVCKKTDVTIRQEVKDLVKFAESTFGPVDILVNNAGVFYYSLMKNVHEDLWEKTVDVNCKGVLHGIGAVIGGMVERKKGHIVNISSENGRKTFPGFAVYSGSKFFVEGVSRSLRQEVCKHGVKVTCIQPGDVDTEIFGLCEVDQEAIEKYGSFPQKCKILEPVDIASSVLYALTQPDHVAINEVLIHPKEAPLDY
ncbi:uncharacterized protein LOC135464146 [Liolophura sinensis]|uniref:uncharacterized protein LOC135464146 n=1 Tax=Liolophura sinensis TaxID=3198878 RepID=UPI0031581D13